LQQNQELEQFKEIMGIEIMGIRNLSKVSPEQFTTVQNLAGQGQLSREQSASAVPYIPNLLEVQKDSIGKLGTVIEKAGANQQAVLDIVAKSLDAEYGIFEDLTKSAMTDEARSRLAKVVEGVGQRGGFARAMVRDINRVGGGVAKGPPVARAACAPCRVSETGWGSLKVGSGRGCDDLCTLGGHRVRQQLWRVGSMRTGVTPV
jgi:hypothetical protein